MSYIYLIIGLFFLIKGADFLIEGSGSLAKRFNIPTLIAGLTIVALGTSLPELIVSFFSASSGSSGIAVGNVVGSNIANLLLVLGVVSIILPLKIAQSTVWKEIPISLWAIILLFVLSNFTFFGYKQDLFLVGIDGILLLGLFVYYLYYLYRSISLNRTSLSENGDGIEILSVARTIVYIIVGIFGLWIGGKITVDTSVGIARALGMSDFLISATVIAIGTSAPELITSIRSAVKKNPDLAVGNIIGSNIINILLVLGLTSTIWGIKIPQGINFDMLFLIFISVLLFLFLFIGQKHELKRWQGFAFISIYIGYLTFIILRG